jgi:hypothetical protein
MIEILIAYAVLVTMVALYYRSKANEFERLFELSKGYEPGWGVWDEVSKQRGKYKVTSINYGVKLNKDGSIAKKRGRKPSNENMGNKK